MDTKKLKLTVEGHATPEESPQHSEICSAASALAQAMVYAMSRHRDGALLKEMDYRPVPGDLLARIYAEDGQEERAREVFTLFGYGMELLAKSHGCSVEMVWDGRKILPDEEEKA